MNELETYLRESRHVFSVCPQCMSIWRLSELSLSREGQFSPDWKDTFDIESNKIRRAYLELQGKEKALRTEAFRKAQKERIPELLKKAAPTFVENGIDPRDIRTLVSPTEFVEFRGYGDDQDVNAIRFLHLGDPSPIHASIAQSIAAGGIGWKTARVGEDGAVELEEPSDRVKKAANRLRS